MTLRSVQALRPALGSLVLAASILGAAAGPALAQPGAPISVHDTALNYTLKMPAGWVEMPADAVREFNDNAAKMNSPEPVVYVRGFMLPGPTGEPAAFVLVQHKLATMGRAEIDSLERSITGADMGEASRKAKEIAQGQGVDLTLSKPSFDRANGRLLIPMKLVMPEITLQGVSHGFVGANGVATVHCYTEDSNFNALRPGFDAIAAGFSFDAGSTYQDAMARPGGKSIMDDVLKYGLIGGVAGGIGAMMAANRKKKQAATAIPPPPTQS